MLTSSIATERIALLSAVLFLTRVPAGRLLPTMPAGSEPSGPVPLGTAYFPLVGAAIGAAAGLTYVLLDWCGLPAAFCATSALVASALLTGALHEDGLADLADGLGGGRTRDRRIEIMRDSRIGVYGTLALILTIGLRWSAISAIGTTGGGLAVAGALIAAHATSRAPLPLVLAYAAPATTTGLAAHVIRPRTAEIAVAVVSALILSVIVATPPSAATGIAVTAGLTLAIVMIARRYLGGYTGDVLGTIQQGGEIAMLAAVTITS